MGLLALLVLTAVIADAGLANAEDSGDVGPVVVRDGEWHVREDLSGGRAAHTFRYGRASDTPIMGDWNGDGRATPGVVRGRTFYLRNALRGGAADEVFSFGRSGDEPIVGDWNGDGRDTVGVVRGRTFYLRNALRGGAADEVFPFGRSADDPVAGDWNGSGADTIGVVRGSTFHVRNRHSGGSADHSFSYGRSTDEPLVADQGGRPVSLATWDRLAGCEANGNWSNVSANGLYYGGLQFHSNTWTNHGGREFAPQAHRASRLEQITVAERVLDSQGWGAWPHCSSALGLR